MRCFIGKRKNPLFVCQNQRDYLTHELCELPRPPLAGEPLAKRESSSKNSYLRKQEYHGRIGLLF